MKILVSGAGISELHERAVIESLIRLGHEVCGHFWSNYFVSSNKINNLFNRFQNKYLVGPKINKINSELFIESKRINPDILFIYRGSHIFKSTIDKIKKECPNCVIVGYNNDDPFSKNYESYVWRHFKKCIPFYDIVFAYRKKNIDEYYELGAKKVLLLMSWFIPSKNRKIELEYEEQEKYSCDVVFVGHYEPDCRLEILEEIVKNGWSLKLFGPGYDWDPVLQNSEFLKSLIPVELVWNDEYSKAISGAKIALCFFSKINNDTYTRRCFEIPATETMLLSEYSEELALIYEEGSDIELFRDKADLLKKVNFYLKNDNERKKIANNGYKKVYNDGHDIDSRMKFLINEIDKIKESA